MPIRVDPERQPCHAHPGGSRTPALPCPSGWIQNASPAMPIRVDPERQPCHAHPGGSRTPALPCPSGWIQNASPAMPTQVNPECQPCCTHPGGSRTPGLPCPSGWIQNAKPATPTWVDSEWVDWEDYSSVHLYSVHQRLLCEAPTSGRCLRWGWREWLLAWAPIIHLELHGLLETGAALHTHFQLSTDGALRKNARYLSSCLCCLCS
ncbi:SCO-spondin-like [Alexandromys fortis]|uniref:SCO-spondin-like n=1 Tax=Alexandromys fortis TaxID=100897 RepID=UPI0021531F1C|nr:SCO-spondin-like [Microtus fortis]